MIDLAAAKAHLRVETTDEDSTIAAYLAAAQGSVQKLTSQLLTQQSVTQDFAGFPCRDQGLNLWHGPVSAIVSIDYDDQDGVQQTLTSFRLVEGLVSRILPAYGGRWPSAQRALGSVRVAYTAGYADGAIPPELDQAVLLLVGHFYGNREAVQAGDRAAAVEMPLAVEMLLAPYSAPGLA